MAELKLKDFLLRARDNIDNVGDHMRTAARPLRVVLIYPSAEGGVKSLLQHFEEGSDGIGFKPPLGPLYVASTVKARSPHEVMVIDAMAEQLNFNEVAERVRAFGADVVGITAWTDFWYPSYKTGETIRAALPDAHICYGGPHVSIYPQETLDVEFTDSVIVGDGEVPFLYLCNMVSHGVKDNSLQGLHFKEEGVKPEPDTFYLEGDLDGLPMPDRTLLPIANYGSVLSNEAYVTTMVTSRGCPHRCTFCKLNFQKNIARSAESVIEEFRQIQKLGIREVEIYDDTFTWGKKRLREICEGLIKEGITVEWAVRDRVSQVDEDLLHLMYKAGCRRIHLGIESGSQKVIDVMKKRITVAQARYAVKAAKKAKLTVLTYWMFGNLNETVDDMKDTIKLATELNSDYAEFSITIPYAGTEMYTDALRDGIISHDYWLAYAKKPEANFIPPELIETAADIDTLIEIQKSAVRAFYFRPKYLIREAIKFGSFIGFLRKIRMGTRLMLSVYVK